MTSKSPLTFMERVERWLLRSILVAVLLLALLLTFAWWQARKAGGSAGTNTITNPASTSVTLTIDYGDGSQKRYTDLPFTPGMTVLDAMNLARTHARGLTFTASGSAQSALINQIDDLRNEGPSSPTKPRDWQYWINDTYGEVSVGAAKLQAGDRVSWAFRPYESSPPPPR